LGDRRGSSPFVLQVAIVSRLIISGSLYESRSSGHSAEKVT
jgi:hypothetical protein